MIIMIKLKQVAVIKKTMKKSPVKRPINKIKQYNMIVRNSYLTQYFSEVLL